MKINLTERQILRYSRHIILPDVGAKGTEKLLSSRVTVIGAGGLGAPALQILAASGIGTLRVVDPDRVDISNLPRQILHHTPDIGKLKVDSTREKIEALNPDVTVEFLAEFAVKENIEHILNGSDYVIEASDNIATKFLVNDACIHLGIPFSIAGVLELYGQILSVDPGHTTCYRCIFNEIGDANSLRTCASAGVLGTVPSFAGILQANEAIKSLLGIGQRFVDGIFNFDLKNNAFDFVPIKRDPGCKVCADPAIPFFKEEEYGSSPVSGSPFK